MIDTIIEILNAHKTHFIGDCAITIALAHIVNIATKTRGTIFSESGNCKIECTASDPTQL